MIGASHSYPEGRRSVPNPREALLTILLFVSGSASPALGAGKIWGVVSSARLDPRVQAQAEEVAAQNQAEVRKFTSVREAAEGHAPVTLELLQSKSLEAFTSELRQSIDIPPSTPAEELARGGYKLSAYYSESFPPQNIRIVAATAEGFHYALLRLSQLLVARLSNASTAARALAPAPKALSIECTGRASGLVIADYPSFPERGIVEGFYGTPWSQQDRLDMLSFEGQHGMNAYYYAPKDDPYHRKLWREPYPPEQMKRLKELVDTAHANFVDFCFAISPGLSMTYSSDEEFARLTAKLESVGKLGVSCFALFLDDVPPELQYPQDQARFKTLAAAHVYLVNKLYRYLISQSPQNRLTVAPTTYTNEWGSRDYIRELGVRVDPHVKLVWTGPKVVSPQITVAEARAWGELLGRRPLVWDNFPVNDGIPWRLNLGPLRGRDPDLPSAASGFLSNPMNQAHASMIPLQTVAEYLWNGRAYSPEAAYRRAIVDQYSQCASGLLAPFLKVYGDYWWQENVFKPLFVETRIPIDLAPIELDIDALQSEIPQLASQGCFLKLLPELSPFPAKTQDRLAQVTADPAFRRLADGKLLLREDYDVLKAVRLARTPALDGDFAQWAKGTIYKLDGASNVVQGADVWKGPEHFSARVALSWNSQYLYVAADITDPELYQPFVGRLIDLGDVFTVILDTAFRKRLTTGHGNGDRYSLLFSPGNFADVPPSIFSEEDYLPPRPRLRQYDTEIKTAWKKTATGFSGVIAIPVFYFEGGTFQTGYEIGLSFGAQKVLPLAPASAAASPAERLRAALQSGEEFPRIVLTSKRDRLFPVRLGNPATYQRLVLQDRSE